MAAEKAFLELSLTFLNPVKLSYIKKNKSANGVRKFTWLEFLASYIQKI